MGATDRSHLLLELNLKKILQLIFTDTELLVWHYLFPEMLRETAVKLILI